MRTITNVVILQIVFSLVMIAQEDTTHNFGVLLTAGTSFPLPGNYYFTVGPQNVPVNIGYSYGLGITYGSFALYEPTVFSISLEALQAHVQTSSMHFGTSSAQMEQSVFCTLVSAKLYVPGRFSPFIKIGVGASRITFDESFSSIAFQSTHFAFWAFGYGGGAGVDLVLSTKMKLSIYLETLIAERQHIVDANNTQTGIFGSSQFNPLVLTAAITL